MENVLKLQLNKNKFYLMIGNDSLKSVAVFHNRLTQNNLQTEDTKNIYQFTTDTAAADAVEIYSSN